ncbi:MAG: helix-turn-helix domain-containing protein [Halobacteriales archaeon]|nr:helix-turn-helix domain-containing protein [Halobacteriales archaeon]
MSKEWDPETIFDVLGSEHARSILTVSSQEPMDAEALAEACDTSLPTVYRRVNALQEYDLLDRE